MMMLARGVIRSEVTTKRVVQQFIHNRHLAPTAASSSSIIRQGFHTSSKASYAHYGRPEDQIDYQQEYDNQSYQMPPKRRQSDYQGGEGVEGESSEKRSKPYHELRGEMGKKLLDDSGNPFWEVCTSPEIGFVYSCIPRRLTESADWRPPPPCDGERVQRIPPREHSRTLRGGWENPTGKKGTVRPEPPLVCDTLTW